MNSGYIDKFSTVTLSHPSALGRVTAAVPALSNFLSFQVNGSWLRAIVLLIITVSVFSGQANTSIVTNPFAKPILSPRLLIAEMVYVVAGHSISGMP